MIILVIVLNFQRQAFIQIYLQNMGKKNQAIMPSGAVWLDIPISKIFLIN